MKRTLTILLLTMALLGTTVVYAQGPNTTAITVPTDGSGHNVQALLTLPDDYGSTTKNYPLLVFLHGLGEGGTDLSLIYNSSTAGGPAYYVAHSQWPTSFTNPKDGTVYKYIVLSPQAPANSGIGGNQIDPIVNYMIAHYRIDMSRFYITGLSEGGQGLFIYTVGCCGVTGQYTPAAVVPMSMAGGKPDQAACNTTIGKGINVWGFGSESDALGQNVHLWTSGNYGGNSCNCTGLGALGRFTAYSGGHCCWGQFYLPTYRETINTQSMSIYEWMLQFAITSGAPSNIPPVTNAGQDQNITMPTSTVTLNGTASDADGTIVSYQWTQTAGTTATIASPTSASTVISGLTSVGTRTFQLTATDNGGASTSDLVNVTVFQQSTGAFRTINVNLYGTASYANSAWNNWQTTAVLNSGLLNFDDGSPSNISSALSSQISYADNGPSYAVTMCPQIVGRDASYAAGVRYDTLIGLDNSKLYDISLYASRANAGQTTRFTVNNVNVDIQTNSNFTNPASFVNIPPVGGRILITITALTSYSYLNGFTLIEHGSSTTIPQNNIPPVARAGADQTITLPTNSTSVSGAASSDDHNIVSYAWSIIGGPGGATLATPNSVGTVITGMLQGTYSLRLFVTDDSAATNADTMQIVVQPQAVLPPGAGAKNITKVLTGEYATSFLVAEADGNHHVYATVWNGSTNVFGVYPIQGVVDGDGGQYKNIVLDSLGFVYIIDKASDGTARAVKVLTDTLGNPFNGNIKPYGWFQSWVTLRTGGTIWYWGINTTTAGNLRINNGNDIVQPMQLGQPAGKQYVKLLTMDYATSGQFGLIGLTSDGTVWGYLPGSIVPTQITMPETITDIGAVSRGAFVAVSATKIYAWGPRGSYVTGATDGSAAPIDVTASWTAIGLKMPLQQVSTNWNTIHFLDANNHLFASGDAALGEVGNGIQYPTWASFVFNNNPAPFGWSQAPYTQMVSAVQIPGTWHNICSSTSIAFYVYGQDCGNQWYSWGRNKQYALGNGHTINNDNAYNCWGNVPAPVLVSPSTVVWDTPIPTFDPTATLPPVASAGIGQCITIPTVSLSAGASSQQSGTVVGYVWTQTSGPGGAVFSSPNTAATNVTNLTTGTYVFRVQVTNNSGLSSAANVSIAVNIPGTQPPVEQDFIKLHRYRTKVSQ